MTRFGTVLLVSALVAFGLASAASAAPEKGTKDTPFNYKLDSKGNRIPKGNKVIRADGSWREEIPQGNGCVLVKEMSADGVYRSFSECPKE